MPSPSTLLVRWCDDARKALTQILGHAGDPSSIDQSVGSWRTSSQSTKSDCLKGCSHLGDQMLSRLVEAFEGAAHAIELVGSAWAKSALDIHRSGIRPEAVRERALRAIDQLQGLAPVVDPPAKPEPITIGVACDWFNVSRKTLLRAVKEGKLKNCRPAGHPPNAAFLLDPDEIERHYPRK